MQRRALLKSLAGTRFTGSIVMGTSNNSFFGDAVLGARSAATAMYALVHEDCEHRATTQCAPQMNY